MKVELFWALISVGAKLTNPNIFNGGKRNKEKIYKQATQINQMQRIVDLMLRRSTK